MSRASSYHSQDIRYDDEPALPLFNTNHHHPSVAPHTQNELLTPQRAPPSRLPPPPSSTTHQARHSISHSTPYSPNPALSTTTNRHHRQGSMSSALPYIHHASHLYDHEAMMPPPSATSSLGSLARSASLGRRKDPYAYSSDDVESGMGSMAFEPSWGVGHIPLPQPHIPPPMPSHVQMPTTSRDTLMSPGRAQSTSTMMNPPPVPSHPAQTLSRPPQTRYDSGGSSPSKASHSSSGQHNAYNNPYVPRTSESGPQIGPSGPSSTPGSSQQGGQWTDYRRPSSNRLPSTGSYSAHSPVSEHQMSSPYLRSDVMVSSPHSPLANPYDLSPVPSASNLPPSSGQTWGPVGSTRSHSPPYSARSLSIQGYPASQPVTPLKAYDAPPTLPVPGKAGDARREQSVSRTGFRQVRDKNDLRPMSGPKNIGRRADPAHPGKYLSTFTLCNPSFHYETSENPRRVLTKPSKPVHNDGADNEDWDYILYVNDVLGGEGGRDRYLILDVLGQGTFGQVVKCQNMRTHEIVAVKVVKNKPAYLNQSKMEVAILDLLNREHDPHDTHHILRMHDSFTHKNHLCLVFECLSSNLYELIKQNQFKGLSTQLVKVFTQQLLDCLAVLKDARLIHCDLKPENILLKTLQSPQIKVIDFGSACHEMQTVYTYIQSRFYRSPEVLLGLPYSTMIDMWSLGCIVVELFLGLPLFPGTSEYNQVSRIVDMMGLPPTHLLDMGKQTHEFFNYDGVDAAGKKHYSLKSMEQYASEHGTKEQPSKQYFKQTKLKDIIMEYPISKKNAKQADIDKEMAIRTAFVDFVQGLLNLDPLLRWSPQQAAKHPFITGEKFTGPFHPTAATPKKAYPTPETPQQAPQPSPSSSKKYGGLVQSPSVSRGQRIYSDAAAYNHQLAQHQVYTAQVQSANAARHHPFSPGYDISQGQSHTSPYSQRAPSQSHQQARQPSGQWQMPPPPQPNFQQQQRIPSSSQAVAAASRNNSSMATAQTNPPPNSYYPPSRNRANTINQMDAIPPALARLTHFGAPDPSGQRNLTPVLNRDEAIREWEKRQSGHSKKSSLANTSYPQLEYLQEQAELAAMGGRGWMLPGPYGPPASSHRQGGHSHNPSSGTHYQMQPGIGASPHSLQADYRRASEYDPPLPTASSSRSYLPTYPPPAATSAPNSAGFDGFDRGDASLGMLYTPLQPSHPAYPSYNHGNHGHRASYSGPYNGMPGANNPFAAAPPPSGQPSSPRYQRRSQGYGV